MAFQYVDTVGKAYFTDEFSCPEDTLSREYRLSVFGDPDNVIFEIKDRMRALAVRLHLLSMSSRRVRLKAGFLLPKRDNKTGATKCWTLMNDSNDSGHADEPNDLVQNMENMRKNVGFIPDEAWPSDGDKLDQPLN